MRFVTPDDVPRLAAWLDNRSPRPPDGSDLEFRILRPDGQLRWGTLSWATMVDRAGAAATGGAATGLYRVDGKFVKHHRHAAGLQGTIRDITQRKEIEAATWRRSQELAALNLIATRINQTLELQTTLDEALDALLEVAGIEFGTIHAVDDAGQLVLRAVRGLPEADARKIFGSVHGAVSTRLRDLYVARERVDDSAAHQSAGRSIHVDRAAAPPGKFERPAAARQPRARQIRSGRNHVDQHRGRTDQRGHHQRPIVRGDPPARR